MGTPLAVFVVLLVFSRLSEARLSPRSGRMEEGWTGDWTLWAMVGSWLATLVASVLECLWTTTGPPAAWAVFGAGLMTVGIGIRWKARRDLGESFSVLVRAPATGEVVRRGLYATIRHPLYLGHVLMVVGTPALLGCRWAWVAALVSVSTALMRSVVEERYLAENLAGYREYMARTWRLIPHLW